MKRTLFFAALLALLSPLAFAQKGEGPLDPAAPKGITVDEIIQRFAAKEKRFKEARDNYTYTQDVMVETRDCPNAPDGQYREVFDVTFDNSGKRIENIKYAPQSTLQCVTMTREDYEDIRNLLPFVLTSDEIPEYDIQYVGQQQEDELHTYVFDIHPRQIVGNKRYFDGRIWVDDHDFQIVKTYGKPVPDHIKNKDNENLFPRFTTYRAQIDGRYWFPVWTKADDYLHFSTGDVHIIELVKYTNYKRFGAQTKITYEGEELPGTQQRKPQQPQPQQ